MDWLAAIEELVGAVPDRTRDDTAAWELAEAFYGFEFPKEVVALTRRFGSGTWGNELGLMGPRELFANAPQFAGIERYFRDASPPPGYEPPWPPRSMPSGFLSDDTVAPLWPFWPEPDGAIAIGNDGSGNTLFLLRHKDPSQWTIGWAEHETGVIEETKGMTEWLCGWLKGDYPLLGTVLDEDGWYAQEPLFVGSESTIWVAYLRPTDLSHDDAVAAIHGVASAKPRSPLSPGLHDTAFDREPCRYRAAGWQRLDFHISLSRSEVLYFWYEDTADGGGLHRVGCQVARPVEEDQYRAKLHEVAAALGSELLELVEI